MKRRRTALRLLAGALLLGGIGLSANRAQAQVVTDTYRVTTASDNAAATTCNATGTGPTGNNCSLRGAIADANADATADLINIVIPAFHIILTNGTLTIDNTNYPTIRIMGSSSVGTVVDDAHNGDEIFDAESPAGFRNMTIENGGALDDDLDGAGLYADASVGIANVTFLNNWAGTSGYGGAIYTDGFFPLSITNSGFTGNQAEYGGAIYNYDSVASIQSGTFKNNIACDDFTSDTPTPATCDEYGEGGAIYNDEYMTINLSTFTGNGAGALSYDDGYGGAIYNDDLMQVNASSVLRNVAGSDGGGFYNDDESTINNTTIGQNVSGEYGGGVEEEDEGFYNGDNFTGNVAGGTVSGEDGYGGGMYLDDVAFISNSTFNSNKAVSYCTGTIAPDTCGSGVDAVHQQTKTPRIGKHGHYGSILARASVHPNQEAGDSCGGEGGGIYNDDTLNLTNVNFSQNQACDGGGLYDDDDYDTINSSRFFGNTASYDGGAIYTLEWEEQAPTPGDPYVQLHNTQVVSNHAGHATGGIWNDVLHDFTISGTTTVITGNSAPSCPNIFLPCS